MVHSFNTVPSIAFEAAPRFRRSCACSGFTLLEVILALFIAMMVIAVAVPAVTDPLRKSHGRQTFERLDGMVQEARKRSHAEGRNYLIVWGRDGAVLMRPEAPASRAEAEGIQRYKLERNEKLELRLPAALMPKGETPDAIWTFWADGASEPAEVRYEGGGEKWTALYNPFTGQAEVSYE